MPGAAACITGRTLRLFLSDEGGALCHLATIAHHQYNEQRFEDLGRLAQDDLLTHLKQLKITLRERLAQSEESLLAEHK